MNITVDKWKLEPGIITDRDSGECRSVSGLPPASTISNMRYDVCVKKCAIAFNTGKCPMTVRTCKYCHQKRLEY